MRTHPGVGGTRGSPTWGGLRLQLAQTGLKVLMLQTLPMGAPPAFPPKPLPVGAPSFLDPKPPSQTRAPPGGAHAVVGADGVEGVGATDEEEALVPHQQHLDEISALCLRRERGPSPSAPQNTPRLIPPHPGPHHCKGMAWEGCSHPRTAFMGAGNRISGPQIINYKPN